MTFFLPTEAIKRFLAEFHDVGENGRKFFKYATQLVDIAHREQVNLTIDTDDVGMCNRISLESVR